MSKRVVFKMVGKTKMPTIGTYHMETSGIGGDFIYGITYLGPGQYKMHHSKSDLYKELMSHPGTVWFAHNSVRFNHAYFIPELKDYALKCKHPIEIINSGVDVVVGVSVRFDKKRDHIEIRDSHVILKSSLDKAIETFAPEFPEMANPIDYERGESFNTRKKKHKEFLLWQAEGLYHAILGYYTEVKRVFGVMPAWTAGGTSMRAWKSTIKPWQMYYRNHKDKERFARLAYYGGFTFPGTTMDVHYDQMAVDRSAAYAASMREGVPCGNGIWVSEFMMDYPGIYELNVKNPYGVTWPLIPYHDERNRLHWTNEECTTFLTSREILYYSKRGYSFEIISGLVWERLEFPFNTFLDMCESMEFPNGKRVKGPRKEIAKSLRNTLSGKFGMQEIQPHIIMTDDPPADEGYEPFIDPSTGSMIEGLYIKDQEADADYINPHWIAWLTAGQRVHLFETIEAVGLEHVHYADTDSIKGDRAAIESAIAAGLISTKVGYGNYTVEGQFEWFQVLGPKNYHGLLDETWAAEHGITNRNFAVAKAISKDILMNHPEYQDRAAEGELVKVTLTSMKSFKRLLTSPSDNLILTHDRRLSSIDNSVAWVRMPNNVIAPKSLKGKQETQPQFTIPVLETARDAVNWLVANGFSISDVARQLGVSKDQVSKIHNGTRPGLKFKDKLAALASEVCMKQNGRSYHEGQNKDGARSTGAH